MRKRNHRITLLVIVLSLVMLSSLVWALLPTPALASPGWLSVSGTAYSCRKMITILSSSVSGGQDLSNFPVLINITDPQHGDYLATVGL